MKFFKNKYIGELVVITIALVIVFLLFPNIVLEKWAISAVIFLFLCELASILITSKKRHTVSAPQSINLLTGLKVGKILLSLFFLLIYRIIVKAEMKRFVLVFFILYLIYLVFDTLYLISMEKEMKRKKLLTKE
jgi:small-conductance mechanosensitive channel